MEELSLTISTDTSNPVILTCPVEIALKESITLSIDLGARTNVLAELVDVVCDTP